MGWLIVIIELCIFMVGVWAFVKIMLSTESLQAMAFTALWLGMIALFFTVPEVNPFKDFLDKQYAESHRRQLEHDAPHLKFTQGDCEIYEFFGGGKPHYFTKCPNNSTTTDTTVDEHKHKTSVDTIEVK